MVTTEQRLKDSRKRYRDIIDGNDHLHFATLAFQEGEDGKVDLCKVERRPTQVRAGDYSVQSVLNNAPELMNQTFVLKPLDRVRQTEGLEMELEGLLAIKKAYDDLPRSVPQPDGDGSVVTNE